MDKTTCTCADGKMCAACSLKSCVKKTAIAVGVLLSIFLLVLSIKEIKGLKYVGKDLPMQTTIAITGHGEEVAIPDIATFTFSVIEEAKTLDAARTAATAKINKTIDILKQNGIAENDMKTLSYNVYPKYEYIPVNCNQFRCERTQQTLLGYELNQTLEIKVRDITKVGTVFDAVGKAGVTNVSGLQFSVDDREAVQDVARAEAIADARTRADEIAKSLGVKIVRIVGYNDNTGYPTPYYYAKEMDMVSGSAVVNAAPQVPTGEQKITSDVTVIYEIR
jgi:uncharacterized protein YggE